MSRNVFLGLTSNDDVYEIDVLAKTARVLPPNIANNIRPILQPKRWESSYANVLYGTQPILFPEDYLLPDLDLTPLEVKQILNTKVQPAAQQFYYNLYLNVYLY